VVRRKTDFSHLHRAIFNRQVFWSAVCPGCVRGKIQSDNGLYCDVIFLGGAVCQIFTSQPVFLAPTICKLNSSPCRRDKSSPRDFVARFLRLRIRRSFVFLKDEHKKMTWRKSRRVSETGQRHHAKARGLCFENFQRRTLKKITILLPSTYSLFSNRKLFQFANFADE